MLPTMVPSGLPSEAMVFLVQLMFVAVPDVMALVVPVASERVPMAAILVVAP